MMFERHSVPEGSVTERVDIDLFFFLMARRADHVNDIDPGTAKRSRKPSKSDRKRRKVGIFTSDVCLFYAEMNHHLNLFNTFFLLEWHF